MYFQFGYSNYSELHIIFMLIEEVRLSDHAKTTVVIL